MLYKLREPTEPLIEKVDNYFGYPFHAPFISGEMQLQVVELFPYQYSRTFPLKRGLTSR